MKRFIRSAVAAGAVAVLSAWFAPVVASAAGAQAPSQPRDGASNVVFVQTDNPSGNVIDAYSRAANGILTLASTYQTDGRGGVLRGSVVDHLASQGSLAYDPQHALLIAVNAGSSTVSVFSAHGTKLVLRQVVGSGGTFPVSIAVNGDLVYVLNALDGGSVSGYRISGGYLHTLESSTRSLGLAIPSGDTQFTHTPGQVLFSPDGTSLLITTKAASNTIDVFRVRSDGLLSTFKVANLETGTVPFAAMFDSTGRLLVADAGTNALESYALNPNRTLTVIAAEPTGQAATCWIASAGGHFYTSNAGSASESRFEESATGALAQLGNTTTDPGTVDAAASPDGRFLYIQTGAQGIVDEFRVGTGGRLTQIGSVTVAGAQGGEGIAA